MNIFPPMSRRLALVIHRDTLVNGKLSRLEQREQRRAELTTGLLFNSIPCEAAFRVMVEKVTVMCKQTKKRKLR